MQRTGWGVGLVHAHTADQVGNVTLRTRQDIPPSHHCYLAWQNRRLELPVTVAFGQDRNHAVGHKAGPSDSRYAASCGWKLKSPS